MKAETCAENDVPGKISNPTTEWTAKDWGVPVDSEHKSRVVRPWLVWQRPHHLSFTLNWICFFITFFSTFAAPPLISIIRQDLNLTDKAVSGANIASIVGAIFARVVLGWFTNKFGPRYGMGFLMLFTASAVVGMPLVTSGTAFVVVRCIIGFGLASFVPCQYWTTIMFTAPLVGTANAIAGGWGNLGGGVTQLVMPRVYDGVLKHQPSFIAWRWAFFLPGALHVVFATLCILFAQDLPDGNVRDVKRQGKRVEAKGESLKAFWASLSNYRTWILMASYGFSFGIELTLDNVLSAYFSDHFDLPTTHAGDLAATFGLMNIVSRPLGGITSDFLGRKIGMPGRLGLLFTCQMIGAVMCVLLGIGSVAGKLDHTIGVILVFSFFIEAACGSLYGVYPFVSHRGQGVTCGMVGAGGNAGSAIAQAIFFTPATLATQDAFKWMGVMTVGIVCFQLLLWFPMWGGLIFPAKAGYTEQDYYFGEYTEAERMEGKHLQVSNFCDNSSSNRGVRRLNSEAAMQSARSVGA